MKKRLLLLSLVLTLAACSSEDGANSEAPTVESPTPVEDLENSGAIPKLYRGDDLQGVDADNNGIRDDIDGYISKQFSESSQIRAARQAARANLAVLSTDLLSPTDVRQTNQKISRATACIYEVFGVPASAKEPGEVSRDIEAISFNTANRLKKYMEFNKALDGASWSLPEGTSCE